MKLLKLFWKPTLLPYRLFQKTMPHTTHEEENVGVLDTNSNVSSKPFSLQSPSDENINLGEHRT